MRTLRLPANWSERSMYQKLCYLVDTHQAQDFSEAGSLLNKRKQQLRDDPQKPVPPPCRLPYADN